MKDWTKITPLVAILAIAGLNAYALSQDINGILLSGSVAIMAGLGGFVLGTKKKTE